MNSFLLRSFILFSCIICFSCSKDDGVPLNVGPNVLTFESGEDSQTFNIIASGEWHIESEGLELGYGIAPSTDWFFIWPIAGKGNSIVTITTKEGSHDNSATVYVKSGVKQETVTLKQK